MEETVTIDHHEKCTKSPVLIVEKKQKFPLNLMEPDLFIVKSVIENVDQEDTNNC